MYKSIHIGNLISDRLEEIGMTPEMFAPKINLDMDTFEKLLSSPSIDASLLLILSKRLRYDFFRIYSNHLLLFSPPDNRFMNIQEKGSLQKNNNKLPEFRKNTYTPEIIMHLLQKVKNGEMLPAEIIHRYHIPKTTLYRWIRKYL
ncbi:MAG: transposase [Bacteroidetes bacterium]|nr:transposase [Bacteroidota bacterium]